MNSISLQLATERQSRHCEPLLGAWQSRATRKSVVLPWIATQGLAMTYFPTVRLPGGDGQ